MKYPKLREITEALVSLFSHAYTTSFPAKPHVPFEHYRGKPVVDDKHCVGCETCANVCPSKAITFRDDLINQVRVMQRNFGLCIFCGQCEEHCITKNGVKLSDKIYDLATFELKSLIEYQEKELLICKSCGAVITTREHIRFISDRLGFTAYASVLNLNLINERLQLSGKEEISVEITDGLKRKDMFNIICPNCLRKVLVKLF